MDTARRMVEGIDNLATLPAVYHRVRQVLDDPDSSISQLANVVAADAALTARLLRVVNSVYFGLMSRVDTVTRAVSMLGMQQVHDIVLAGSVASMFKGMSPASMNMTRFWSSSIMRALVARTAAEMAHATDTERFFVAGLLADIGHLVMYQIQPSLAEQAQREAVEKGIPLEVAERTWLECDYAEVGSALAERWQLPVHLAQAIRAQIDPSAGGDERIRHDAAILNLTRITVDGMEANLETEVIQTQIAEGVWQLAKLKPANLAAIRMIAEMNHNEVITLFFPQLSSH
jgi:HD-like signal output (HDOD) protein